MTKNNSKTAVTGCHQEEKEISFSEEEEVNEEEEEEEDSEVEETMTTSMKPTLNTKINTDTSQTKGKKTKTSPNLKLETSSFNSQTKITSTQQQQQQQKPLEGGSPTVDSSSEEMNEENKLCNLCRVCGKFTQTNRKVHFFTQTGKANEYKQRIVNAVRFLTSDPTYDIQESDSLPHFFCRKCHTKLVGLEKAAINLRESFKQGNTTFSTHSLTTPTSVYSTSPTLIDKPMNSKNFEPSSTSSPFNPSSNSPTTSLSLKKDKRKTSFDSASTTSSPTISTTTNSTTNKKRNIVELKGDFASASKSAKLENLLFDTQKDYQTQLNQNSKTLQHYKDVEFLHPLTTSQFSLQKHKFAPLVSTISSPSSSLSSPSTILSASTTLQPISARLSFESTTVSTPIILPPPTASCSTTPTSRFQIF